MDLTIGSLTGNYHDCRPLYIRLCDENNEEHVIVCARGSIIQVVSSLTGSLIGTFNGHKNAGFVTCIAQFSSDKNGAKGVEIVSASNDGMISIWNLQQCKASREFHLDGFNGTIFDIFAIPPPPKCQLGSSSSNLFVTIESGLFPGGNNNSVSKKYPFQTTPVDLKNNQLKSKGVAYLQYSRNCVDSLCFDNFLISDQIKQQETQVLVVGSKRKVIFLNARDPSTKSEFSTHSKENLTCLATNSITSAVVTGHANGMILIWHKIKDHLQEARFFSGSGINSKKSRKRKLRKEESSVADIAAIDPTAGSQPVCTALHWHAHAVCSLALSFDGNSLFSGGEEAVLVVWHQIPSSTSTSNSSFTSRSFIPRLGGGIAHVVANRDPISDSFTSVDASKIIVTTLDNSIRVVNTVTLKIDWVLRSICVVARKNSIWRRSHKAIGGEETHMQHREASAYTTKMSPHLPFLQSDLSWKCKVQIEPRSNHVVCNGSPGLLQSFDLDTQTISDSFDIVSYARVTRKEVNSKIYIPSITHFQFASDPVLGDMLVTVDVRKGESNAYWTEASDTSLKFWEWSVEKSKYRLSAQMENPHGSMRISDIALSPGDTSDDNDDDKGIDSISCLTSSVDGTVKMWRGLLGKSGESQLLVGRQDTSTTCSSPRSMTWSCTYSFKYRDCPASCLKFSQDKSLFAVSYQNLLTLWDPASVTLRASLVGPSANNITFAHFVEPKYSLAYGGGSGQALLVLGTKRCLSVFDLLTMKPVWHLKGHFSTFAVANGSSETLRCNGHDGWICAASIVQKITAGDQGKGEEDVEDQDIDAGEENEGLDGGEMHRVSLFGLYSAKSIASCKVSAKVNSLVFRESTSTTDTTVNNASESSSFQQGGAGVLLVTENSELLYFGHNSQSADGNMESSLFTSSGVDPSALPASKVLPSLQMADVGVGESGPVLDHSDLTVATAPQHLSKGWLRDIFDENTDIIPSLSTISSGFMSRLLRPHSNTTEGQDSTVSRSQSTSVYANPALWRPSSSLQQTIERGEEGDEKGQGKSASLESAAESRSEDFPSSTVLDSNLASHFMSCFSKREKEASNGDDDKGEEIDMGGQVVMETPTAKGKEKGKNKVKSSKKKSVSKKMTGDEVGEDSSIGIASSSKSSSKIGSSSNSNGSSSSGESADGSGRKVAPSPAAAETPRVDSSSSTQMQVQQSPATSTPLPRRRTRSNSGLGDESDDGSITSSSSHQKKLSAVPVGSSSRKTRSNSDLGENDDSTPDNKTSKIWPTAPPASVKKQKALVQRLLPTVAETEEEVVEEGEEVKETTPSNLLQKLKSRRKSTR